MAHSATVDQQRSLTLCVPGALGTNQGPEADGILAGFLKATDPDRGFLETHANGTVLCFTDNGGAYVDETTAIQNATADDVEVFTGTPAIDDAAYFGHATLKFARLDLNLTTDGVGTYTVVWEYWNGTAFTALAGISDGTSGFTAGSTGFKEVTFTQPTDWAKNLVDGVDGFWVRARISAFTISTTLPQVGQGFVIVSDADAAFTDDTTDLTDVGTGDVALLPAYPVLNDAFYFGLTAEKFCKVEVVVSTARTGTATLIVEYWNGTAWGTITGVVDDSNGWSATAGTYLIHFEPPSDWVANTAANGPNSTAGFFVRVKMSAFTSVTADPLATQAFVYPLETGGDGVPVSVTGGADVTIKEVHMNALTKSATNADSKFLLVNVTRGTFAAFTWTQADAFDSVTGLALKMFAGDKLVLTQIQEDGTTEFADANFVVLAS